MDRSPKRRRVALFRNNFLPYSETFIHDELRFHERYDSTVMARTLRNADRFPGHDVVAVDEIPGPRSRAASLWYAITARSGKIERAMSAGSFDIAHAHFGHNGIYAMGFARRHRIPLAVSLHGRDVTILLGGDRYKPGWWYYTARYRRLFEEAALFLAASEELKELITSVGCPKHKVIVHRLGVDIDSFHPDPARREADPPLVVMVGRFVEKKGHEYGIRACAAARDRGRPVRLAIIGDGPLKARYETLIRELELEELVEMPGSLKHSEVLDHIVRATVVLAPSVVAANLDRESGLIVVKEASACGVPAIGTIHGGIPEIIDEGVTGFLVPERDPDTLGDRLVRLLEDEDLRAGFAAAARAKMEAQYDIKKRVAALEDIYDSLVDGGRPEEEVPR